MVIRGTIRFEDGTERTETMDIGHYMRPGDSEALMTAWASGDEDLLQAVINHIISERYLPGNGIIDLIDTERIDGLA